MKGVEVSSVTESLSTLMTTAVANNDYEIMVKDDKRMTNETRQSIMGTLGISNNDVGVSFREDKVKGVVRVQKGRWFLNLFNESWTGIRMIVEEYLPKKINTSLIRNMVSHVYKINIIGVKLNFCLYNLSFFLSS